MRRTTIALSAVALAVTLGACSQGSPGASDSGDGQDQGSSGEPHADVASLSSGATSSAEEKQTVSFTTKISGGGPAAGAGNMDCQVDIAKTEMSCTGDQMDMVATADATYLKMPQLTGDPAKPWMKVTNDGNDPMSMSMGQQSQAMQKMTDFKQMLPKGTEITNTTQEEVAGQDATRYDTVTNVQQASEAAPKELKPIFDLLVKSGVQEINQTIWVSSDDLPLKAETKQPPMKIMGQQVPAMTTEVTYRDWGKPVQVDVPPAGKVAESSAPQVPNMPQPPN